jgi:plastocyanin
MKTIKNRVEKIVLLALALVSLPLFFNSCSKISEPPANQVYIQNMAFSPATLTVTVGTTVKWTNKDGITHTVTSDSGIFDSGNVNASGTFSYMFMTAGTYSYHCKIHSSMIAKIVVN